MGWAFLWSFIIYGAAAGANSTVASNAAGTAATISFFVIWYFASKAHDMEVQANRAIQSYRAKEEEAQLLKNKVDSANRKSPPDYEYF